MTFVPTLALVGKMPVIVGAAACAAPKAEPPDTAAAAVTAANAATLGPLMKRMSLLLRSLSIEADSRPQAHARSPNCTVRPAKW
jgi:hypothetical protein